MVLFYYYGKNKVLKENIFNPYLKFALHKDKRILSFRENYNQKF